MKQYSNNMYTRKFFAEDKEKSFGISISEMNDLDEMAEKVEDTKTQAVQQIEEEKRDFIKEIQEQSKKVKESYDSASKYIQSLKHLQQSFQRGELPETESDDSSSDSAD